MTEGEYKLVQQKMMTLTTTLAGTDLDSYVDELEKASAISPMVDPQLYREKGQSMEAELEFAKATVRWRDEMFKIAERWKDAEIAAATSPSVNLTRGTQGG